MAVEFLGTVPAFLGAQWFLGTIGPFLGTRCPKTEVLSDFALCQKCALRNSFQGILAGARRLLVLVLRSFALHVDHLLPENVPKRQRRMPRKERLSREIT